VTAHHCFDDMTVAMAKMPAAEIVDLCMEQRPHVVLLGAGASHAAFSDGDADGRSGPVMNELVSFNGVGELLRQAGLEGIDRNFEELLPNYGRLPNTRRPLIWLKTKFGDSSLKCDFQIGRLVLSLRSKYVIATFNWDPILVDACRRNARLAGIPFGRQVHCGTMAQFKGRVKERLLTDDMVTLRQSQMRRRSRP